MVEGKHYILFCAGEDSGDCIGECLVSAACNAAGGSSCVDFVGAGGPRMIGAGLKPLVDYESLPVSGFGDVLPKYLKLRKTFGVLKRALEHPLCLGLVSVDYPGFNMKLVKLAGALNKPSLYVAPPQVWAWKAKRARQLSVVKNTKLSVFFDFEKDPYEIVGCNVSLLQHPFVESVDYSSELQDGNHGSRGRVLLLPGSRKSQTLRNVPVFLNIAKKMPEHDFLFVAARDSLLVSLKNGVSQYFKGEIPSNIGFAVAPSQGSLRSQFYGNALGAVSSPGTATLELALSGCSFVVVTKPDSLTYALGKRFVKTSFLALPNIILGREQFAEFIKSRWADSDFQDVAQALRHKLQCKKDCSKELRSLISKNRESSRQLMSEFLAQFF